MDVDEALASLGRYSKWQLSKYALLCMSVNLPGAFHIMTIVFTGAEPPHHCHVPENSTQEEWLPQESSNGEMQWSQCLQFINQSDSNETTSCSNGWDYDPSYGSTIVTEWNLVCGRDYLPQMSQSFFTGGVLVGALIFSWLADKFGRKPVHLATQWLLVICGTASAFSPNITAFIAFRFIMGALREGTQSSGIIMMFELFPATERTFAGTAFGVLWVVDWALLTLLAYIIRDWRYLQLAVSITSIYTLAYIWILPESIQWLWANGKTSKATSILQKAAKFNGINISQDLLKRQEHNATANSVDIMLKNDTNGSTINHCSEDEKYEEPRKGLCCNSGPSNKYEVTILDLFKSRKLFFYALILCYVWFANSLMYYGLSLSTSILAGDRFVTFLVSGLVEIPAYLMPIYVLKRFGRRYPMFTFNVVGGIGLILSVFIPREILNGFDLGILSTSLAMIGKFGITASFQCIGLVTSEIYPTNIRNVGIGISSVAARIGGMIAPFYVYLAKDISFLPGLVCSVLSVLAGLLMLLLPETNNKQLPHTIEDVENLSKSNKCKSSNES